MIQALLGYTSEARFLRYADTHLRPWFPYLYHSGLQQAAAPQ